MQQTQIIQGLAYYERIIKALPSVKDMACAKEDDIMFLWKGLGYYSRARNMHKAAKTICEKYDGIFPVDYKNLLSLPGIGPYTASAIASFAYDLPYAVLDGNVFRVLSRVFAITTAIDSTEGRQEFRVKSQQCLEKSPPAEYNQAIMDFGALICSPNRPRCNNCPLNDICEANRLGMVGELPFKSKKINRRKRFLNYFIVRSGENYLIEKRTDKDIWQGLYQFPLVETLKEVSREKMQDLATELFRTAVRIEYQRIYQISKKLTHQEIHIAIVPTIIDHKISGYIEVSESALLDYAYPIALDEYIRHYFR